MNDSIALVLNQNARKRLNAWRSESPAIVEMPGFTDLLLVESGHGGIIERSATELDALIAWLQFLTAEPDLAESEFIKVADVLEDRIRRKGWHKFALDQVPDLVYEGQIGLLLSATVGLSIDAPNSDDAADFAFKCEFQGSGKSYKVAIECKNIRSNFTNLRDLARSCIKKIGEAHAQHSGRTEYDDTVVFLDLPPAFVAIGQNYIDLCKAIWGHFENASLAGIYESKVIFTSTCQSGMVEYVQKHPKGATGLQLLPPVVRGDRDILAPPARLVLLSFLYRKDKDSANVLNFQKYAIPVNDYGSSLPC